MVGFASSWRLRSIALIVWALAKFSASPAAAIRRIQSRSAPAQNAEPLPVSTTMRAPASAWSALNASVNERMTVSSMALRTFGRLIVTVTTPRASLEMRTVDSLIASCRRIDYGWIEIALFLALRKLPCHQTAGDDIGAAAAELRPDHGLPAGRHPRELRRARLHPLRARRRHRHGPARSERAQIRL